LSFTAWEHHVRGLSNEFGKSNQTNERHASIKA
jgi:hypothetical protein